jgi:hypothetical protein
MTPLLPLPHDECPMRRWYCVEILIGREWRPEAYVVSLTTARQIASRYQNQSEIVRVTVEGKVV